MTETEENELRVKAVKAADDLEHKISNLRFWGQTKNPGTVSNEISAAIHSAFSAFVKTMEEKR